MRMDTETESRGLAANLGFELYTADGINRIRYAQNYQPPIHSNELTGIAHGQTNNNDRHVLHGSRTNNEGSHLNEIGKIQARKGAEALWNEIGAEWVKNPENFVEPRQLRSTEDISFEDFILS